MSKPVTIVDYGIGNLMSVARAVEKVGATPVLTHDVDEIKNAERLILPGVGAFGKCISDLKSYEGLEEAIRSFVATERPLLGICVGMQMLFEKSEEFGDSEGFGLIEGVTKAIPNVTTSGEPHKIPHIGWTEVNIPEEIDAQDHWSGSILQNIAVNTPLYFVHSYTAWPANPEERLADCIYGGQRICAAIKRDNITATQFHPEKSGAAGLEIINSFSNI